MNILTNNTNDNGSVKTREFCVVEDPQEEAVIRTLIIIPAIFLAMSGFAVGLFVGWLIWK